MIQQSPWYAVCELMISEALRSFDEIYQQWNVMLQAWLDDLLSDSIPDDWHERLDQFIADTEQMGLEILPDSIRTLEELIESRIRGTETQVVNDPAERVAKRIAEQDEILEPSRPPVIAGLPTPGHRPGQSHNFDAQPLFDEKLKSARRHYTVISQLLEVLGEKLDAAKPDEDVDVDYEVRRIIEHLRLYNDDLEAARSLWLRHQLPDEAIGRLHEMHTPISLGLPPFFDDAQAARERKQTADIGRKLNRRLGSLDSQISTLETIDTVGTAAGIVAGAGAIYSAVKVGGKHVVIKSVGKAVGGGAVAAGVNYGAEQALHAMGASDQTIRGVRLAAAVVSLILSRRAARAAAKPPLPPPRDQKRYTWPGHRTGVEFEEELAHAIHELPDEVVIYWGERIGKHGGDIVSVNRRTGDVTLWDGKYRGSARKIQPSETFQPGTPRDNAIRKAVEAIEADKSLRPEIRKAALKNLQQKQVKTRTVGGGKALNSTLE